MLKICVQENVEVVVIGIVHPEMIPIDLTIVILFLLWKVNGWGPFLGELSL